MNPLQRKNTTTPNSPRRKRSRKKRAQNGESCSSECCTTTHMAANPRSASRNCMRSPSFVCSTLVPRRTGLYDGGTVDEGGRTSALIVRWYRPSARIRDAGNGPRSAGGA